jgi:DNA-binding GntR family transcriptional regulator
MPGLAGTKRGSLRLAVYRQLRDLILQGYYAEGTALTELAVSQKLGVSRTPVREAFRQLELDGLVVASPNRSVTVHCYTDQDILDLYEVRSRMEGLAAARAAVNMNDNQLDRLEEIYQEAYAATKAGDADVEQLKILDAAFHDAIFRGSGSSVLDITIKPINYLTGQARLISLSRTGRSHSQIKEHLAILEAIRKKDSKEAEKQMQRHIANAAASYREVMQTGDKKNG